MSNRRLLENGGRFDSKPASENERVYTVKKGDTLSKLAQQFGGNPNDYKEFLKYNDIDNPDLIYAGQKLIIPESFNTSTITINKSLPEIIVTGNKKPKYIIPEPNTNYHNDTDNLNIRNIPNSSKSIEELNKPNFLQSKLQDIKDVINESNSVSDFIQTGWNGIAKHFVEDKEVKTKKYNIKVSPKPKRTDVLDENFTKEVRNGTDTLFWDRVPIDKTGNKYYIQESYPITENMKFGARNRGDYTSLNSNNAPITTYKPFYSYEEGTAKGQFKDMDSEGHQNHFIGFDKNGKFKLGPYSEFKPGDVMTNVYYSDIINISKDDKGNVEYKEDPRNPGRFQPVINVYGESTYDKNRKLIRGKQGKSVLTTMSKKRSLDGSYGNVSGGRVLLKVGDETRLVSGSINHVIQEIELMQKNHKGKPIRYYQLDNGSYNRGLRTRNGKNISNQDLKDYDRQNTNRAGGGHFMYILNN